MKCRFAVAAHWVSSLEVYGSTKIRAHATRHLASAAHFVTLVNAGAVSHLEAQCGNSLPVAQSEYARQKLATFDREDAERARFRECGQRIGRLIAREHQYTFVHDVERHRAGNRRSIEASQVYARVDLFARVVFFAGRSDVYLEAPRLRIDLN